MSQHEGNVDDFGMDTISLAGPLKARLDAIRAVGFSQVMLQARDLADHAQGWQAAVQEVKNSALRVTGFQTLRDFEGFSGQLQRYKIDVAKSMLEMCQTLGCRLLVVNSSTLAQASGDTATLIRNLRQLAMLAIPMNIRIAYKAWSLGHTVKEFPQAWDLVSQADMPNLGLCLDAAEMLAAGTPQDELDMLDPEKLFLVQLADSVVKSDPSFRVFPGEGEHNEALAALVTGLHDLGYRGAFSLAVSNDDYLQMPLPDVTQRAWRSALWLGQDVLQRSVPLPNQIRLKRVLSA
jgi:sugar phosphate isomerase/epimerase